MSSRHARPEKFERLSLSQRLHTKVWRFTALPRQALLSIPHRPLVASLVASPTPQKGLGLKVSEVGLDVEVLNPMLFVTYEQLGPAALGTL